MSHKLFRTMRSQWRRLRWALAGSVVPFVLWACNDHALQLPKPVPESQTDQYADVNPVRKLDLLFMIDNSNSMKEEQDSLRANFPKFMAELRKIPGASGPELPDVRIAIISSDVGSGANGPCLPPQGDRGRFQVKAGCGLDSAQAHWLAAQENGAKVNFTGKLEDVFACMASLGVDGCGYEHQLQSIRAALSLANPENQNFVRPDAYLGIIILSDEDDCSAPPESDLFARIPDGHNPNLVCGLQGHTCKGQMVPPNEFMSPLSECKPTEASKTKLIPVEEIVNAVKAVKAGRNDRIIVAGIIGWDVDNNNGGTRDGATYRIAKNVPGGPGITQDNTMDIQPICSSTNGKATPGIRLKGFIDAFGSEYGSTFSICKSDLSEALVKIGQKIAARIGTTCVTAPLVDKDAVMDGIQAECQILDRLPQGAGYRDVPVRACPGAKPCWKLTRDEMCKDKGSNYKIDVERDGPPPTGTLLAIKCLTCTQADDPRCADMAPKPKM